MGAEVQRPASNDDRKPWKAYWEAQGMPWRTEPEIDEERQRYLAERRANEPDIEKGIYPFKDIKLDRADVEWLLATHESGGVTGPVNWSDEEQREHVSVDLRGSVLQNVNLGGLPLACMLGAIPRDQRGTMSEAQREAQREAAAVHMEGAELYRTHLEGAILNNAHLEGVHLQGTFTHRTHLESAELEDAHLERAQLDFGHFEAAKCAGVHLEGASLQRAHFDRAHMRGAWLSGADLRRTHFERAWLEGAHFEGKRLESADLARINKVLKDDMPSPLLPADLRRAYFGPSTVLDEATLGNRQFGFVSLADVRWSGVNLAVVKWTYSGHNGRQDQGPVVLGDERRARQPSGSPKGRETWLAEFETATRAYRQLATVLREQGQREDADRFSYRAQLLQRHVLHLQRRHLRALGSWLLDLIAGYGYKPMRSVITYLVVILCFAAAYFAMTNFALTPFLPSHVSHLAWYEAIVLSISCFHGRGFFPSGFSLGDPVAIVAAFEAIIGLLIEITFIATFTQRFFAR